MLRWGYHSVVVVALWAAGDDAMADGNTSTSTAAYASSNGSLGVPAFGTFASLDNGLRPVIAYGFEGEGFAIQLIGDDSRKFELTDPSSPTLVASSEIGFRVSKGGITSTASAKEGYLMAACGAPPPHPSEADCEGDPRLAVTQGVSLSLGGRMTLGPDHIYRGLAAEAIATTSRRPFLAYVGLTARKENHESGTEVQQYDRMHEYGISGGASLRAWSWSWFGGAYIEMGITGRMLWFEANDRDVHHTTMEMGVSVQFRFAAADLVARFVWQRHDTVADAVVQPDVNWIFALQPTVFF